nr:reverse transcriptase domain-containing protein [Tanacetum cinerariifolium]
MKVSLINGTGPLTPTATRIMDSIKTKDHFMKVQWNGANKYQVSSLLGDQCVVDIVTMTCSCDKWELTKIPYHAVGQDGLGRSGVGAVIGLSTADGQGGACGPGGAYGAGVGVGSQVSDNGKFLVVDEKDLIFKKISPMAEDIMVLLREGLPKKCMRTRSSSNLTVEPVTIPKRRNRRRSKQIVKPEFHTIVETHVTTMADARTMSELLQAPTHGYGDAIVILAILANNFELKITSTLKYRNVPNEAIKLMLFPFSLDGAAQIWLEKEPPRSILTWEDLVSKFVNHFFPLSKTTNLKNDIINFQQRFDEAFVSTTTSSPSPSPDVTALTEIVKELVLMNKATQQATVKAIEETCVTCGGPHPYYECLATDGNTFDACAARQSPSGLGSLPSDTVANPRGDVKAITTQSGVAYEGPSILPISSSLSKEVEREPEVTRDKVQTTSLKSTAHVHPPVMRDPIPKPKVVPKPNPKPSILYPLRLNNQKLKEKTDNQMMKCMMAIFHDMIEETMEVFMDDFLEKCHFLVKEGIVLGHKILKSGIEVDRAKVDVIAKLPHPTFVKGVRIFLGHARFYRRFIQDFSKIALPMTHLLKKETSFIFSKECIEAFNTLKKKLIEAPILVAPDWDLPFEIMCDASDFAVDAVLGQLKTKHFQPIHYAYDVFTVKKPLISSWLAIMDPPEDIMVCTTPLIKSLMLFLLADDLSRCPRHEVMLKYGVTNHLSIVYHPQTSGQVVVSNHGLKRILEKTVGENRASWSDKLDDALWAFRTTFKTPIGCTPYKLVYEKACHLPIKLEHKAYWALKHCNFDLKSAGDHWKVQMKELNELRDQAYQNSIIYKEKTKKIHDSKIKNRVFNIGDRVLLFNSRLTISSGKLKTRWTRPFTVTQVFPYGTIELSQTDRPNFKVNDHRLKHDFEGDIPPMVIPDLQTFPIDH